MALADIVRRIDLDAQAEAAAVVSAAEAESQAALEDARRKAERAAELTMARARVEAQERANLAVAGSRLRGRDRLLAEKRVLIDRVFGRAREELLALNAPEYAGLIARDIVQYARGGEEIMLGTEDATRLADALPSALKSLGCEITVSSDPAPIARGALLVGSRMRVEVSIDSMLDAKREGYEALVAAELFGGGE